LQHALPFPQHFCKHCFFGLDGSEHIAALLGWVAAPLIMGLPSLMYKKNPLMSYSLLVALLLIMMIIGKAN
tara:strand:- start:227 stop:439 length:213 start_codon:yes stop_codon:yes gene_type:complete